MTHAVPSCLPPLYHRPAGLPVSHYREVPLLPTPLLSPPFRLLFQEGRPPRRGRCSVGATPTGGWSGLSGRVCYNTPHHGRGGQLGFSTDHHHHQGREVYLLSLWPKALPPSSLKKEKPVSPPPSNRRPQHLRQSGLYALSVWLACGGPWGLPRVASRARRSFCGASFFCGTSFFFFAFLMFCSEMGGGVGVAFSACGLSSFIWVNPPPKSTEAHPRFLAPDLCPDCGDK